MKRRTFLKLAPAGIATALTTGALATAAQASPVQPDAVGVLYDATRCIGCRSCEAACRTANAEVLPKPEQYVVPEKPFYDRSVLDTHRELDFQRFTVVNRYDAEGRRPVYRKFQCNHCVEPACASACFVKALHKTPQGPVSYRADLCVGCRYCMMACPFYVPTFNYGEALNPLIYKCTLCAPRLAKGLPPACVAQCPEKALVFGKRAELLDLARQRFAESPGRYVNHIYGEHEVGGTSWLYLSPVPHEQLGQPALGTAPIPDATASFLGSAAVSAGLVSAVLGVTCLMKGRRASEAVSQKPQGTQPAANGAGTTGQTTETNGHAEDEQ